MNILLNNQIHKGGEAVKEMDGMAIFVKPSLNEAIHKGGYRKRSRKNKVKRTRKGKRNSRKAGRRTRRNRRSIKSRRR